MTPSPGKPDLVGLANRVSTILVGVLAPRAVLLTGSVAEGTFDEHSDVDMIVYDDAVPTDAQLQEIRSNLSASDPHWSPGSESDDRRAQAFRVDGIECQVAAVKVSTWEADVERLLEAKSVEYDLQKAIVGLQIGASLHGEPLVARWRKRVAEYPLALGQLMVQENLDIFPLWLVDRILTNRDAVAFTYQMLSEATLKLLGILAGINHAYFSPSQLKRMTALVAGWPHKPDDFAMRANGLFAERPLEDVAKELKALAQETLRLVELRLPDADISRLQRVVDEQ